MPDLPDASVWLTLSAPDHVHHARALRYWHSEASEQIGFCRITALALLRHLTNPRIVGPAALDGAGAWRALQVWLAQPGVQMFQEPATLDTWLERWSADCDPRGGNWTDAYLAAFAAAGDCRLVAFDGDFYRYKGIQFLHLVA